MDSKLYNKIRYFDPNPYGLFFKSNEDIASSLQQLKLVWDAITIITENNFCQVMTLEIRLEKYHKIYDYPCGEIDSEYCPIILIYINTTNESIIEDTLHNIDHSYEVDCLNYQSITTILQPHLEKEHKDYYIACSAIYLRKIALQLPDEIVVKNKSIEIVDMNQQTTVTVLESQGKYFLTAKRNRLFHSPIELTFDSYWGNGKMDLQLDIWYTTWSMKKGAGFHALEAKSQALQNSGWNLVKDHRLH